MDQGHVSLRPTFAAARCGSAISAYPPSRKSERLIHLPRQREVGTNPNLAICMNQDEQSNLFS
jgi:hypothetical protein